MCFYCSPVIQHIQQPAKISKKEMNKAKMEGGNVRASILEEGNSRISGVEASSPLNRQPEGSVAVERGIERGSDHYKSYRCQLVARRWRSLHQNNKKLSGSSRIDSRSGKHYATPCLTPSFPQVSLHSPTSHSPSWPTGPPGYGTKPMVKSTYAQRKDRMFSCRR